MTSIFTSDWQRIKRCGIPEVIYGEGKSEEDVTTIILRHLSECGRAIVTKLDENKAIAVEESLKESSVAISSHILYNSKAKVMVVKKKGFRVRKKGSIGLITAGTSDIPVAEEARIVAEELGCRVVYDYDVGIAGIHRLSPILKKIKKVKAFAIIVVAGMEGALPSVVGGLVDIPVIGVPTSVGYGTGKGGRAALFTMLNSCTPVAVVNIDNGYGAAVLAYQIMRRCLK